MQTGTALENVAIHAEQSEDLVIRTDNPSAKLHVQGNSDDGDAACQLRIELLTKHLEMVIQDYNLIDFNATNTGRIR